MSQLAGLSYGGRSLASGRLSGSWPTPGLTAYDRAVLELKRMLRADGFTEMEASREAMAMVRADRTLIER